MLGLRWTTECRSRTREWHYRRKRSCRRCCLLGRVSPDWAPLAAWGRSDGRCRWTCQCRAAWSTWLWRGLTRTKSAPRRASSQCRNPRWAWLRSRKLRRLARFPNGIFHLGPVLRLAAFQRLFAPIGFAEPLGQELHRERAGSRDFHVAGQIARPFVNMTSNLPFTASGRTSTRMSGNPELR